MTMQFLKNNRYLCRDKARKLVCNIQSASPSGAICGRAMQTVLGADVGLKANDDYKSLISRIFQNLSFPSGTTLKSLSIQLLGDFFFTTR